MGGVVLQNPGSRRTVFLFGSSNVQCQKLLKLNFWPCQETALSTSPTSKLCYRAGLGVQSFPDSETSAIHLSILLWFVDDTWRSIPASHSIRASQDASPGTHRCFKWRWEAEQCHSTGVPAEVCGSPTERFQPRRRRFAIRAGQKHMGPCDDPKHLANLIRRTCGCQCDCFAPFRKDTSLAEWMNLRKMLSKMRKLEKDDYVRVLQFEPW